MANVFTTIADMIKLRNEPLFGLFEQVKKATPALNEFTIEETPLVSGQYPVVTDLPKAAWRPENVGKEQTAPTVGLKTCTLKFLDGSWNLDQQVAMSDPNGVDHACDLKARTHLQGMMQDLEYTLINGDSENAAEPGFDGLLKLAEAEGRVIGEGGDVAICVDRANVKLLGREDSFAPSEIKFDQYQDGTGKALWGHMQNLFAYLGMLVGTSQGILAVRADALSDELLTNAIADNFYIGYVPDLIIVSRQGRRNIRNSRTAYNPVGAQVPPVEDVDGIKLIASDAVPYTAPEDPVETPVDPEG